MIPQATLVMVMLLLDTGRCWNSMPMPICPTTCEDFNLDHSSLVACSYSYNLLKNFLNQSSVDVPDILRDGNFKVTSSRASPCYSCSQVNTSMSMGNLSKCLTSSIEHFNKPGFEGLSGFIPVLSNDFHYWPVANLTCHEAQKLTPSYECRATNSECVDLGIGAGYHCICSTGFKGNPYLVDGCLDIDECVVSEPCEGTCTNLIGSYSCSCPPRFEGDGKKDGSGCYPQRRTSHFILGKYLPGQTVLICFVVPAFAVSWIFWQRRQKKVVNLRRSLFSRNGGELLQAKQFIQKTLSILTAEDLKKATNNYDDSNVLSQEHHLGITYRGILPGTNSGVTALSCI